ncbi:MAG: hypothetical protein VYC71_03430, partial [Planctomycetota bacterium]|nr:hypothetical protein [Planctomycetota bacterium]
IRSFRFKGAFVAMVPSLHQWALKLGLKILGLSCNARTNFARFDLRDKNRTEASAQCPIQHCVDSQRICA